MRIKKTRYYIPYSANINGSNVEFKIELDFFQTPDSKDKKGREIVMAEVEFHNKELSDWFTHDKWPDWFKADVTDKKGTSSKSIARSLRGKSK